MSEFGDLLRSAYRGKRVLLTGHTGFKGGWLALWLAELGAEVTGYALAPSTTPSLFDAIEVGGLCRHRVGDVRDRAMLGAVVREVHPDFVFHLAAQPLVRLSYELPIETLETNFLGTANLLEALRREGAPCAVVVVTSDKCYENRDWPFGYREHEPMGGRDVYSMSKGAVELLVASYRSSFFPNHGSDAPGVVLATARAGNVIGGGDWAPDRLMADAVRALSAGKAIPIRNPASVRPWQHVLEPLGGYLRLGAYLAGLGPEPAKAYAEAWNFGPLPDAPVPVREVITRALRYWGEGSWQEINEAAPPHEARTLRLSIEKAAERLGWRPRWSLDDALERTMRWYRSFYDSGSVARLRRLSQEQIAEYA